VVVKKWSGRDVPTPDELAELLSGR
jgi:hypothetical protein